MLQCATCGAWWKEKERGYTYADMYILTIIPNNRVIPGAAQAANEQLRSRSYSCISLVGMLRYWSVRAREGILRGDFVRKTYVCFSSVPEKKRCYIDLLDRPPRH